MCALRKVLVETFDRAQPNVATVRAGINTDLRFYQVIRSVSILSASTTNDASSTLQPRESITSNRIAEIGKCFGIMRTISLCASVATIGRPRSLTVDLDTNENKTHSVWSSFLNDRYGCSYCG